MAVERWVAVVKINGLPVQMSGEFGNYLSARAYFLTFGEILSGPRIGF